MVFEDEDGGEAETRRQRKAQRRGEEERGRHKDFPDLVIWALLVLSSNLH